MKLIRSNKHWLTPGASALAPRGLALRGVVLLAAYAACEAAGWRTCTSFLCGMRPGTEDPSTLLALAGMAYVIFYLLAMVLAPVLILAAGLSWAWGALRR